MLCIWNPNGEAAEGKEFESVGMEPACLISKPGSAVHYHVALGRLLSLSEPHLPQL